MRVLHVINCLAAGGAERQLFQEIAYLAGRGVEQWLVELEPPGALTPQVRSLIGPERTASLNLGPRLGNLPFGYRPLARLARAWKPQVISTQLPQSDILGRLVAGRLGLPAVSTWQYPAYDLAPWEPLKLRRALAVLRWAERRTAGFAAHFMAVSETVAASYCKALNLERSRCSVIPNTVDLGRFPERPVGARRAPGEGIKLIHVGRHVPQKGIDTLLEALTLIPPELKISVDFYGAGPQTAEFERFVKERGLETRARFKGKVPDMAPVLPKGDGFLLPSRSEGLSLAYLEALAAGLPVIASEIAPNREVDPSGRATRFVAPDDPGELSRAIVEFAEKPDLRAELARQARSAAEPFSLERVGPRIYDLFAAAAEGREPHACGDRRASNQD